MAKIMVVDDAAFMRMMVKVNLTKLGHEVLGEASNGEEAAIKYEELHPDIVLMDITMPEVNGIDGLKKIKALNPNAKVIMCSAMGQESYIVEAIQCGASDFIVKPFKIDRMQQAIEKVLNKK